MKRVYSGTYGLVELPSMGWGWIAGWLYGSLKCSCCFQGAAHGLEHQAGLAARRDQGQPSIAGNQKGCPAETQGAQWGHRHVNMIDIDNRIDVLDCALAGKQHDRKKRGLGKVLCSFLVEIGVSPKSAAPRDVRCFLVWKEAGGKTKLNAAKCLLQGWKVGHAISHRAWHLAL